MNKITLFASAAILLGGLTFSSCNKDKDTAPDDADLTEVEASNEVEGESDDLNNNGDEVLRTFDAEVEANTPAGSAVTRTGLCWTGTLDPTTRTVTLTFDGTCQGRDGRYRSGTLTIQYDQHWRFTPNARTILTPTSFYVSRQPISTTNPGNHLEGTHTRINQDSTGRLTKVEVRNARITFPDGSYTTWESDRMREFSAGYNTPGLDETAQMDDEFRITSGSTSGLKRNGLAFIREIQEPVLWKRACWLTNSIHKPVSGIVRIRVQGKALRTVDFGTGTCDNLATVTVGNRPPRTITLR